jgi:hypothetical protein
MSLFLHPHLTRGIVHTPMGSFVIHRGVVDVSEDVGRALGWEPVDPDDSWIVSADGPDSREPLGGEPTASTGRAQQSR